MEPRFGLVKVRKTFAIGVAEAVPTRENVAFPCEIFRNGATGPVDERHRAIP